ncbi:MAG: ATP-binding protein [Limnohabitans sp.]|nr:ATP-binding protein [Limnohabitans sp.]
MLIDYKYLQFISPFSMIVSGPSGSGKSFLIRRILKNHKKLIEPEKDVLTVLWVYGVWQKIYEEPIENVKIEYTDILPTEKELDENKPDLIVIDDLMNEISDNKQLGNLFTKISHHNNINVIFIMQNSFNQGKQMRNLHLNSHYLIIMKNPRDMSQIDTLGRQLKISNALNQAYKDATKSSFGYLIIDFKQTTPREYMLKTRITPEESENGIFSPIFYLIR